METGGGGAALGPAPARAARPRFNPFVPEFAQDPYPLYDQLRTHDPVQRGLGMWILTRHADVLSVLTDRSMSSAGIPDEAARRARELGESDLGAIERLGRKSIVFTDNPEHARLRRLVNRSFGPRLVESCRGLVEAVVDRCLDRAIGRGPVDFIAALADPVPLHVMSELMGLPEEVRPAIKEWTHRIRFLLEPGLMTKEVFADVRRVLDEYMAMFREIVRARVASPGDDLLSLLVAARSDGDELSEEEVVFSGIMTFVAGHETTKCLLGNGLLALLRHPEQEARLRRDPALLPGAVNEMFRYDTPLQQTKRRATTDVTIGGKLVKAGDQLLLCLGAANRDPARFPDPGRFDPDRAANPHLGLGYGMHQCLGGLLAKTEAQAVFAALLRRTTAMALADDAPLVWQRHSFIIRGLETLPVVLS